MRKATYIVKPSEITPVSSETAHRAIEVHKYFWTEKHIAKLKKVMECGLRKYHHEKQLMNMNMM